MMNLSFKSCGRLKLTFLMTLSSLATSMEFQVIILFNALGELPILFMVTLLPVTCKLELLAGTACGGSGLLLLKSALARLPFSVSIKTLGAARSRWAATPPAATVGRRQSRSTPKT